MSIPELAPARERPPTPGRDPARPEPRRRRRDVVRLLKPVVFAVSLLPALLLAWNFADSFRLGVPPYPFESLGANPIEALEQRTGRWALIFLFITLGITPLRRLTGWNPAIRFRRMLGLFGFLYATLHVSAFIAVDMYFDWGDIVSEVIERPWITIGMASWLLLVPLALTSTKGWIRRLGGRRWNLLHRLIYVAAVGGTLHFYLAVKQDTSDPIMFAAILALLLGARLWWRAAGGMKAS